MTYIGIDNGISGGLVALSDHPGAGIINLTAMPAIRARKGNEVDVALIWAWMGTMGSRE